MGFRRHSCQRNERGEGDAQVKTGIPAIFAVHPLLRTPQMTQPPHPLQSTETDPVRRRAEWSGPAPNTRRPVRPRQSARPAPLDLQKGDWSIFRSRLSNSHGVAQPRTACGIDSIQKWTCPLYSRHYWTCPPFFHAPLVSSSRRQDLKKGTGPYSVADRRIPMVLPNRGQRVESIQSKNGPVPFCHVPLVSSSRRQDLKKGTGPYSVADRRIPMVLPNRGQRVESIQSKNGPVPFCHVPLVSSSRRQSFSKTSWGSPAGTRLA